MSILSATGWMGLAGVSLLSCAQIAGADFDRTYLAPPAAQGSGGTSSASSASTGAGGSAGATGSGGHVGAGGGCAGGGTALIGTLEVIACDEQLPATIITSANLDTVAWISEASGTLPGAVRGVDRDGATAPKTHAPMQPRPTGLRGSMGTLYFTNDLASPTEAGLFKVPDTMGPVVLVDGGDGFGAGALALQGQFAYTAASAPGAPARVRKTALDAVGAMGGCYPYESDVTGGDIAAIVIDNQGLYVADTGANAILKTGLACGSAKTLFAENQAARALSASMTEIFWVTSSELRKQSKAAPGGTSDPMASAQGGRDITLFLGYVIFTNEDSGTVVRVKGGSAEVIATGQGGPHSITHDAKSVFWTNRVSGEIVRWDP